MKLLLRVLLLFLLLGTGRGVVGAGGGVAVADIFIQAEKQRLIEHSEFQPYESAFATWDIIYNTAMVLDAGSNLVALGQKIYLVRQFKKFIESTELMVEGSAKSLLKEQIVALKSSQQLVNPGSIDDLLVWASKNDLGSLSRVDFTQIMAMTHNNIDFTKKIALATKEIRQSNSLSELAELLNLPENPMPQTLSLYEARVWYNWRKLKIIDLIDQSQSLENQARQAVNMRNEIRTITRQAMRDSDIAEFLNDMEINMTWEDALSKYGTNYNEIIQASMRGRGWLNGLFKIPD